MLHRTPNRPHRTLTLAAGAAFVTAAAGLVTSVVVLSGAPASPAPAPAPAAGQVAVAAGTSPLDRARARTREVPRDPAAWSALAFTALEAGRASADPALYAEAGDAARTSLAVRPDGNDLALAAQAALADAEHDFARGRDLAQAALAVNPRSPAALAALTDALTELGRLDEALDAARRLDAVRPGVASFTRLSYQAELRGDVPQARHLMDQAAQAASTPAEAAFARAHEGLLALGAGDLDGARRALDAGRLVAPDDVTLDHLAARLAAARGDLDAAANDYTALLARRADPTWAAEQADVLDAAGDTRAAGTARDLARAGFALQAGAGVRPEGVRVLFEADHGDPADAVRLGRDTYRRSPTAGNADALAWALHRAGDDREALRFADRALAPTAKAPASGRPAVALFHRGAVRAALGDRGGALADLRAALDGRPRFSPAEAAAARQLLDRLEATP